MACTVCQTRIDPAAAPTHPSCDPTPDALFIRRAHAAWLANLTA